MIHTFVSIFLWKKQIKPPKIAKLDIKTPKTKLLLLFLFLLLSLLLLSPLLFDIVLNAICQISYLHYIHR